MTNEMSDYERGKDDGIKNTLLYYFGLAVGQMQGMGFGRDEVKAQVDKCFDVLEAHGDKLVETRESLERFVKSAKEREQ
jgi:hypothetical protein